MARNARKSGRCVASSAMRARSFRPEMTAAMERCSSRRIVMALFIAGLLETQEGGSNRVGNRRGARQSPRAEAQNQEAGAEPEGARRKPGAQPDRGHAGCQQPR